MEIKSDVKPLGVDSMALQIWSDAQEIEKEVARLQQKLALVLITEWPVDPAVEAPYATDSALAKQLSEADMLLRICANAISVLNRRVDLEGGASCSKK